jgi:uroporphyrinogen-III decarboxylase
MKERWTEIEDGAKERQEQHFAIWLSGEGIPFESLDTEKAYKERIGLIKDAIQLVKPPQRVPVCPAASFFPACYAGLTLYDAMYDYGALARIWEKYCVEFAPDAYDGPGLMPPGKVFDLLNYTLFKWPGHGVSKERSYQFIEGEYMRAEEYQDLIDDPSGYFLRVYFPRIFEALKPFEIMPLLPVISELVLVCPAILPLGTPDLQKALHVIMDAASEATRWADKVQALDKTLKGKGYPILSGGLARAPFDVIGDSLRGTAGVMMDMYRHPEDLLEACERITPFMVKAGVEAGKSSGHPIVFMPLHKGADGFMSDNQFRTFYWPTLKKVIIGIVNEGFVPYLFAEGGYNSRLEVISDLPKGTTVWWFDRTDMAHAKKTVGKVACIAGNVPLGLLCTGSEDQVKDYCKGLIDTMGKNGGFILSAGAGMEDAKPNNVKAMIDFSKVYGTLF